MILLNKNREVIKQMKKQKGITLIALVVTIIVLIILAGVSIRLVLGDNGIVQKAMLGKENMEKAQKEEDEALLAFSNEMDLHIASSSRANATETLLFEGKALYGDITFSNGHSIDEFDAIRFIIR